MWMAQLPMIVGRSVIDYCLVDQDMFSQLQLLRVLPNVPFSDHHPLEGQFLLPTHQPYGINPPDQSSPQSRSVPTPKFIPEKREEYGAALDQKLRGFLYQVSNGEMLSGFTLSFMKQLVVFLELSKVHLVPARGK